MKDFYGHLERSRARKQAEADGVVADSHEVRLALMARVKSGEITLEAAQAELARIKGNARRNGKVTRSQAYRGFRP